MTPRKIHPVTAVAHRRLQGLRQLHQQAEPFRCTRRAIGVNDWMLGIHQQSGDFPDRTRFSRRRRHAWQLRDRRRRGCPAGDLVFLHERVDGQERRPARRRHRELVGTHGRLAEVAQRSGRVVQLRVVADHRRSIGRGMQPVHSARAAGCVDRRAHHHEDRNAIRIRVVDGHRTVLQAHRRMHHAGHWLAFDLGVAMRHRDRGFFMHRRDETEVGRRQHPVIDDGLVQAHERVAGRGREILDAQTAQHVDHEIATAARVRERLVPGRGLFRARL